MPTEPAFYLSLVAAAIVHVGLRRRRHATRLTYAITTYLLLYAAAQRWGWHFPAITFVLLIAVIAVVDITKYPYAACPGCNGRGKHTSPLTASIALCAACNGSGRQTRATRRIAEKLTNLPQS